MGFSVSRQTTETALLVSFAVFTVCYAGLFERNNETGLDDEISSGLETASSEYPIAATRSEFLLHCIGLHHCDIDELLSNRVLIAISCYFFI